MKSTIFYRDRVFKVFLCLDKTFSPEKVAHILTHSNQFIYLLYTARY